MRIFRKEGLTTINDHAVKYPTPINLNYFWGLGSLAFLFLIIQIITGILLAMHYVPHADLAFESIQHIMREVKKGWAFRYIHSTGSSFFFAVVYLHVARGLYFGSYYYPRGWVWLSGVVIFLLMMATAFLGYVLPWGQMSFWAATVITNLFSAFPLIGDVVTQWMWGGFSVGNPTLKRFFVLHYLLPFIILSLVGLHLLFLHRVGSGNPLGVDLVEAIPFYPYFFFKDLALFFFVMLFFFFFAGYLPHIFMHPDNNILANPMITPAHIVPEWYFLPFYAMLRAVPDKLGGVLCMFASIVVLFFLPLIGISTTLRTAAFRPIFRFTSWFFIFNFFLLGWLGACAVEFPFAVLSQVTTNFYFLFFIIFLPFAGKLEFLLGRVLRLKTNILQKYYLTLFNFLAGVRNMSTAGAKSAGDGNDKTQKCYIARYSGPKRKYFFYTIVLPSDKVGGAYSITYSDRFTGKTYTFTPKKPKGKHDSNYHVAYFNKSTGKEDIFTYVKPQPNVLDRHYVAYLDKDSKKPRTVGFEKLSPDAAEKYTLLHCDRHSAKSYEFVFDVPKDGNWSACYAAYFDKRLQSHTLLTFNNPKANKSNNDKSNNDNPKANKSNNDKSNNDNPKANKSNNDN